MINSIKRYGIILSLISLTITLQAQSVINYKTKGFFYQTNLSFAAGIGNFKINEETIKNKITVFALNEVIAYQFNPHIYIGGGVGFEIWKKNGFIPIFATIGLNVLKTNLSPYLYVNLGYANRWYVSEVPDSETDVIHGGRSGLCFEGGLGLKTAVSKRSVLSIALIYKLQDSQLLYNDDTAVLSGMNKYSTNNYKDVLYMFLGAKMSIHF